ncbi:MAG: paraquat-inducible protein A [Candidatus Latescibacterota bacterium]|nr:MAG: paraquat-inducible protein A [Candidatus Latescibacterota bacterium]
MSRSSLQRELVLTSSITTIAAALYFVGLFTPMATITTKFLPLFDRTTAYSLVETIRKLFEEQEYVLGVILVLFTFVFPVTKFFSLFMGLGAGWRPHNSRLYRWMRTTGRWSMLDVFVVAFLVVLLRIKTLTGGMSVHPEVGIYCFGASVLLAIWAGNRIDRIDPAEAPIADEAPVVTQPADEPPPAAAVRKPLPDEAV